MYKRQPYEDFRAFFHGHTYTGNALACAVAIANLDIFARDDVLGSVNQRADQCGRLIAEQIEPLEHVGEVRRWGLMTGIELLHDRETGDRFPVAAKIPQRIVAEARRRGVIIRPLGNVMILMPPLSISASELVTLVGTTHDAIVAATRS